MTTGMIPVHLCSSSYAAYQTLYYQPRILLSLLQIHILVITTIIYYAARNTWSGATRGAVPAACMWAERSLVDLACSDHSSPHLHVCYSAAQRPLYPS